VGLGVIDQQGIGNADFGQDGGDDGALMLGMPAPVARVVHELAGRQAVKRLDTIT